MGHALDETLQDILIRFKKMQGYNALWIPGTDHASIATEVKIINALKEEGIEKEVSWKREVLRTCLGLERRIWWNDHRTDEETWIFL